MNIKVDAAKILEDAYRISSLNEIIVREIKNVRLCIERLREEKDAKRNMKMDEYICGVESMSFFVMKMIEQMQMAYMAYSSYEKATYTMVQNDLHSKKDVYDGKKEFEKFLNEKGYMNGAADNIDSVKCIAECFDKMHEIVKRSSDYWEGDAAEYIRESFEYEKKDLDEIFMEIV